MSESTPARKSPVLRSSAVRVGGTRWQPARSPDNRAHLLPLFEEGRAEAATRTAEGGQTHRAAGAGAVDTAPFTARRGGSGRYARYGRQTWPRTRAPACSCCRTRRSGSGQRPRRCRSSRGSFTHGTSRRRFATRIGVLMAGRPPQVMQIADFVRWETVRHAAAC